MKMEIFFDYTCPFCLKGHEYLLDLIGDYKDIEIIWKPTEAHPRPEVYGKHSDLCHQALLFALEKGVDVWLFHENMYDACLKKRIEIESVDALCVYCADFLDAESLRAALEDKRYEKEQSAINDYAYDMSGVWALPSYRMEGKKLDSILGVGITKGKLKKFLDNAKK